MKIHVYVTAHEPLLRLSSLRILVAQYKTFDADTTVFITVNYESREDIYSLYGALCDLGIKICINCSNVPNLGFALPWFSASNFAEDVRQKNADYYIYQEDDIIFSRENFEYYVYWYDFMAKNKLEPGFVRYEYDGNELIPFDNYHNWFLNRPTPGCLPTGDYTVPSILINKKEGDLGVLLGNPYYGALILNQSDAEKYIKSESFDPNLSFYRSGCRQWPIADRRSMGLCFEDVPKNFQHRRCVVTNRKEKFYVPVQGALVLHDNTKYTKLLKAESNKLITVDTFLQP